MVTETFKDLFARGYRARSENHPAESRAIFIQGVRKAAIDADQPSLAEALCGLAQAERDIGNVEAAIHHYSNAVALYRQLGPPARLAYTLRHQADVLRENSQFVEAEPLYLEAETTYRQLGEGFRLDLANTLRGLALVNESTARLNASKTLWREARDLYAKCEVEAGASECDERLANS